MTVSHGALAEAGTAPVTRLFQGAGDGGPGVGGKARDGPFGKDTPVCICRLSWDQTARPKLPQSLLSLVCKQNHSLEF